MYRIVEIMFSTWKEGGRLLFINTYFISATHNESDVHISARNKLSRCFFKRLDLFASKSTGKKTIPNWSRGSIFGIQIREGSHPQLCGWLPRSFQWTNRHTTIILFIPDRRVHPLKRQGKSFFPAPNLRRRGLRSKSQRSCVTLFFARDQQSASLESKAGPFFFSSLLVSLSGERRYAVVQGAALCLSKRAAHAAADVVFVHRTSGKKDRGV